MLQTSDLDFSYPEELVATSVHPRGKSRILYMPRDSSAFEELSWDRFLAFFKKGDSLVLNDTQVLWARLLIEKPSGKQGEIFFLKALGGLNRWEILARALNLKVGGELALPGGWKARVLKADRVSTIEIQSERPLSENDLRAYFEKWGEVPLPPYIVGLRKEYKTSAEDRERYQTLWAKNWGSVAAPTAGLHFTQEHLEKLKSQGVKILYVTLHVGAGTFLPIETQNLEEFKIHSEFALVGPETCEEILKTQAAGKKVWACGTTALRALETAVWASGTAERPVPMIAPFMGETNLFVKPGYKFRVVEGLLTNFHQPQSSLLALAAAFVNRQTPRNSREEHQALEKIKAAYQFAIQKKFRLFSYGDLTVMA